MDLEAVPGPGHGSRGMVHEGVPYAEPVRLAGELCGPVAAALASGDPVVVVLDDANRAALETALGPAAAHADWRDPAEVHRVPAFTVAMRWARLSRPLQADRRTTIVAQHGPLPGVDRSHWPRLDAAASVALDGLPVTLLCPVPVGGDLDLLRATHPSLLVDGVSMPTTAPWDPARVLAAFPPPPPPDLGPPLTELAFTMPDLPHVRRVVGTVAEQAGLDAERTADVVLAVNEIATNSVEHGPGAGRLRLWEREHALLSEVYDVGRMATPFPGMVPPSPSGERGRGLWLASELSDVLQVWSDDSGTTVRLRTECP